MPRASLAAVALVGVLIGWFAHSVTSSGRAYTLYRNSGLDDAMRVHVATFDSTDGEDYNMKNCNQAELLFKQQPGVTVRYWCEKGSYRP